MIARFAAELGTACATAGFGTAVVVGALEFGIGWDVAGPEPGAFPFYVGLIIIAASLGTLCQVLLGRDGLRETFIDRAQALRVAGFFGPMLLFVAAANFLGLYVATALYLFAVMWLQGGYKPLLALATGIAVAVFFYLVLEVWFQVPLLKGPLETVLGVH
jgi:hypothetical protein